MCEFYQEYLIHTANSSLMSTAHTSTIVIPDLIIDHIYLVLTFSHNLLSIGQLCELGLENKEASKVI